MAGSGIRPLSVVQTIVLSAACQYHQVQRVIVQPIAIYVVNHGVFW
jgi:hypothetical protein